MTEDEAGALYERLRALPVRARNALIFDLLADAGVRSVVIPGENGEIEGYVADRTIALKYLKNKSWSIEKVALARALFQARGGGSYVDLGANIGTTVIPIAMLGTVACEAVEPEPANFRLLTLNLRRNGVAERVHAHNIAVYAERTTLEFEIAPVNLGDHRLRLAGGEAGGRYGEAERATAEVPAAPLDEIVDADALAAPLVVKMDIQGAEPFAFAGGGRVFDRAGVLMTEYWPYGVRRLGADLGELHQSFARYFAYGAILEDDQAPESVALGPVEGVIERLAGIGVAGTEREAEAIDIVFAKEQRLW